MKKQWTDSELARLKSHREAGTSIRQIADLLGRSPTSVSRKLDCLPERPEVAEKTLSQDREAVDEAHWQRRHADLARKYATALKEQNLVDRLVSEVKTLAPVSYDPHPKLSPPKVRSKGRPQSAVLELSDTHIGKAVYPSQTLCFGEYNFPIFLARLKYLEESVISIVRNHVNTPVPELVIAMLGDMLDGALKHSNECGQVNPLFNQFFAGGHALAQFIRNLAPHFPLIRIYEVVGNHTRFADQKKMPTENKHSNFDKFLYAYIQALVRDLPNVKWELSSQPYQVFDVNGFGFFAGHGETLRGGDKTLGIPNHAVGRVVSTTSQLFGKYGKQAPNYYLYGHLHRNISLPHATGDVIINGGFVGVDGFGLSEMFTPADPMQKLFFVHPVYGKTATYDISLKFADRYEKAPYEIPAGFSMA